MSGDKQPPSNPKGSVTTGVQPHRRIGSVVLALGILLIAIAASIAVIGAAGALVSRSAPAAPPADVVYQPSTPLATSTSVPATVTPTPAPKAVAPAPASAASPPPLLSAPIAAATPVPAPRATPQAEHPSAAVKHPLPAVTHIAIPAVGIDTRVVEVGYQMETIDGKPVMQWQVADYAAGHAALSAEPGGGGNIVIAGHDDWKGEVFKNLHEVKIGDQVVLTTSKANFHYAITEIHYRKATGTSLGDRLAAGQFLAPMPQERLTLVTCWPYGVDSYRLIVVAKPVAG